MSKLMTKDDLLLRNYFCIWRGIAERCVHQISHAVASRTRARARVA